ncbi:MAG: hypothetical protein V1742_11055 [Pseudomonadota bacterium]
MELQPDFKELLSWLNEHQVEYLIVGGYALAFHGAPRFTGDLDILINPDPKNAGRVMAALEAFGFRSAGLSAADFQAPGNVIQLGFPPVRIDIMTSITGVPWPEAFSGRAAGLYGDVPVFFIGRSQLMANKRALGRKRDLADLEALGEE